VPTNWIPDLNDPDFQLGWENGKLTGERRRNQTPQKVVADQVQGAVKTPSESVATNDKPAPPLTPPSSNRGILGFLVIAAVVLIPSLIFFSVTMPDGGGRGGGDPSACVEASNARASSNGATNESDRSVAAMQYAVKAAECKAAGGTVP
jgi:hypothetical protein